MVFSIGMKRLTFSPDNLYTKIRDIIEVLEDLESVEENQSEIRLMKAKVLVLLAGGSYSVIPEN